MFISDYFNLTTELNDKGIFDAVLDRDSHFFINVIRLKSATTPEFKVAYEHLNQFFSEIATLLDASDGEGDLFYNRALKRFKFSEVNGINLGFAETSYGAGFGEVISKQVIRDAFQIVKKGSKQPEIFQLVGLFEENVASDRISDMVATIILKDIEAYTLRMYKELGITQERYPEIMFNSRGFVKNPFKNAPILLLPVEILHELPIAKDWYDIDRVVTENRIIREEINAQIGAEWKKWASSQQKDYIKKNIFMQPDACERVIEGYRQESLEAFQPTSDYNYLAEILLRKLKNTMPFGMETPAVSSFKGATDVIELFKSWVEDNKGWDDIQSAPSAKREKVVQRLLHLAGKYYVQVNNLDYSFEPDAGRGPVDLKFSRGNDKTIVEVKLSSNGQYLHGYEEQVQEYGKAETTDQLIYVFVDIGNPGRRNSIIKKHKHNIANGIRCPELIVVNATEKKAASTYDASLEEVDFNLEDIEFPDLNAIDFSFESEKDGDPQ